MRKSLGIIFIIIPFLCFSQTNAWWEKTHISPFQNSGLLIDDVFVSEVDEANGLVYVAGVETIDSGKLIYVFDGAEWTVIGSYFEDIYDMALYQGYLYLATGGISIQDTLSNSTGFLLTRFDPENYLWEPANADLNGAIRGLEVIDDTLYLGGSFTANQDNTPFYHVAKYDGEELYPLPDNPFADMPNYLYVSCFEKYNGDLYIGGLSPDVNDEELLVYHDGEWSGVGDGIQGLNTKIDFLEVYDGELYAGGIIWQDEGNPANGLQKWDGETWTEIGGGVNGTEILCMETFDGGLFVGGYFNFAGNELVNGVARWDGEKWCGLHTDTPWQGVPGMFVLNDSLYMPLQHSDTDPFFDSYAEVYKWIGGDDYGPCSTITEVEEMELMEVSVFPNPANSRVKVSAPNLIDRIRVFDISGKILKEKNVGSNSLEFDISNYRAGIYILKINTVKGLFIRKVIKTN
ncbi:MAG: T9SS type A sorting domain-containing protein [Flavobacteriales bacterium]|nr:T9SS type A sorting domain-containing protein [Flavobacteriales bacterium]